MIKIIPFLFFILLSLSTFLCADELIINKNITYPYNATEDRENKIKSEYKRVNIGMPALEVIEILGEPDETQPLFEPKIKKSNQTGYTHWYLIQRLTKIGSVNEKQEKLVRISYDLDWKVIALDHWGL